MKKPIQNRVERHFQIEQIEHRCKSEKNQNVLHSKKYCRIQILILQLTSFCSDIESLHTYNIYD